MPRPYTRTPCGIYGPRNLTRRHARKVKQQLQAQAQGQPPTEPPPLLPGQEQLFSFYAPSLEAGVYTVSLDQAITAPVPGSKDTTSLDLPVKGVDPPVSQQFEVVAPRFTLPDNAVHSSFPPQGYGALAKTLPHVVLSDPHLPWTRIASLLPNESSPDWTRNQVPWLALLVFTADELTLTADELSTMFTKTALTKPVTQSQTLTITMQIADVSNIQSVISPITSLPPEPSDGKSTDLIFVKSTLFSELFTSYDTSGNVQPQTAPDVSRYKYLAHVRDINTTGMADAGVEDNGVFGIVVSHRTGPLSNTQPQPVVAHLVSIEGVENMTQWPIDPNNTPFVAMSSLFSWNFVTLPGGSFDIETTFQHLANGVNVLRAPDNVISSVDTSATNGKWLQQRLQDGYTLTKQRVATGETSAALFRGPLTPTVVPYPLMPSQGAQSGSVWLSNSGIDLQVMDSQVGVMDITYSVAWQLGKTLAVSDQVFTVALGKLRTALFSGAMNAAKIQILQEHNAYSSLADTVSRLPTTIATLNTLHKKTKGLFGPGGGMADRWRRPGFEPLDLSYHGPLVQRIFQKHCDSLGQRLMMSSDGDGSEVYDEQNTPVSVDWMAVLNWVLNKMFLYNIPAQYLIVDPSYLGPETLRFFHVDRNWTDALIDGALSLGNNLAGTDLVRQTIHGMISTYVKNTSAQPVPQVPLYGFLMRSEAVTKYPDLKVSPLLGNTTNTAPILRHENLDVSKGVMICLLDQLPGSTGLQSLTFTPPPHQQSFIAGAELGSHYIKTMYKQIYTQAGLQPNPNSWDTHYWARPADPVRPTTPVPSDPSEDSGISHATNVFKWGLEINPEVRTLLPTPWSSDVSIVLNHFGALADPSDPLYKDSVPNSAMAGIQLNDPVWQLVIQQTSPTAQAPGSTVAAFPPSDQRAVQSPIPAPASTDSRGSSNTVVAGRALPVRSPPQAPASVTKGAPTTSQPTFKLGPSHGPPAVPPPHYRSLRPAEAVPSETVPLGALRELELGSGPPTYSITCVPLDNDPQHPGIPCGSGIPKDLVFKIVQKAGSVAPVNKWLLQSFIIDLRLAGQDPLLAKTCLLSDYTGPGPFMISNLRFNVIAVPSSDPQVPTAQMLRLKLVPRSTNEYATTSMCKEMSFILPVCTILDHVATTPIPVWVTLAYRASSQPTRVPNFTALQLQQEQ